VLWQGYFQLAEPDFQAIQYHFELYLDQLEHWSGSFEHLEALAAAARVAVVAAHQ